MSQKPDNLQLMSAYQALADFFENEMAYAASLDVQDGNQAQAFYAVIALLAHYLPHYLGKLIQSLHADGDKETIAGIKEYANVGEWLGAQSDLQLVEVPDFKPDGGEG